MGEQGLLIKYQQKLIHGVKGGSDLPPGPPHKREKSSFISSQNYPWFTLTFQQNQAAVFNQMQDRHGLIELVQLSLKIKIMIVDC